MKPLRNIAIVALLAVAMAGCSISGGLNSVTNGLNGIFAALSSKAATQSAANLRSWGQAFACFVSNGALIGEQIEAAVKAKQAAVTTTGTIYTVSAIVCQSLGGTPSTAPVPVVSVK